MSVARPGSGLLPAISTVALVGLLAERPGGAGVEQVIGDLAAATSISWARARNTVAKLVAYNLIARGDQGTIAIANDLPIDCRTWIADRVSAELASLLTENEAWSCIRIDAVTGGLVIDSMTLPSMSDGLNMWITDFGIASRPAVQARFWTIAEERHEAFLGSIREENFNRPRRTKSAEQLAAELALQAERGEAAERWVLDFERMRLRGHPLRDQIRRISQEDVSAGYDIVSFASQTSLRHDLFIEVKSHGVAKIFHWSRNEIAIAREFGEAYALYLIDSLRCGEPGYSPHVITGPSPEMFTAPESGWTVEPTSFEHVAVRR